MRAFERCFRGGSQHALHVSALRIQQAMLDGPRFEGHTELALTRQLPADSPWAYAAVLAVGRLRESLLELVADTDGTAYSLGPTLAERRVTGRRQIDRIASSCALLVEVKEDNRVDESDTAVADARTVSNQKCRDLLCSTHTRVSLLTARCALLLALMDPSISRFASSFL